MKSRVLALDQATNVTGWSLYEDGSLTQYGKKSFDGEILERINQLRKWLDGAITELLKDGGSLVVAIEEIQLQQIPGSTREGNVDTFKKLAWVQGTLLELLTERNIKHEVIPSSSWKSTCGVRGRNRAEQKRNAQAYVLNEFGIKATQDECDAICIGKHMTKESDKEINWD